MRKVLITAGAAGIGRKMVEAFLAAGDRVFICDIDQSAIDGTSRAFPELLTSLCDVGDRASVKAMVASAAEKLGGIDVLVNNAGIGGPTKAVKDLDDDEWDAVLRVNLNGTFNVTKSAIPHLIRSGKGAIINM